MSSAARPAARPGLSARSSGVFATRRSRGVLAEAPPALLTFGISPSALGKAADRLGVRPAADHAELERLVLRHRGASGIVARSERGVAPAEQTATLRKHSSRIPILLVGTSETAWLHRFAHVFVCSVERELPILGGQFASYCGDRAARVHSAIDRYGGLVRLTGAEADLVYRFAMGIRSQFLHSAQGVSSDTKKERLRDIRRKAGVYDLDEMVDAALYAAR